MIALWLAAAPALANGQTTHVWITRHALEHLPAGELRTLLTREDLEPALINGAMFPDGGYAVNHDYGEHAHWHEFQSRYRDWIVETYDSDPFDDEGAWHVAFLMGLVSHGMADQAFDAMYFNWSSIYDAEYGWAEGVSFDEASDVIWAALTGPQEVPPLEIPADVFVALFAEHGFEVDAATLEDGQSLLGVAIEIVGLLSENPETVRGYQEQFPWGGAHLLDGLPGSPPCEGEIVAGAFQETWDKLRGHDTPLAIIGLAPGEGHHGLDTAMSSPEARLQVVFARGVSGAAVAEGVTVTDEAGRLLPVTTWVTYGDGRNVAHLAPQEDWPADQDLTVTVHGNMTAVDGSQLGRSVTYTVSTRAPESAALTEGCGCTAAGSGAGLGALWPLLGLLYQRRRSAMPVPVGTTDQGRSRVCIQGTTQA